PRRIHRRRSRRAHRHHRASLPPGPSSAGAEFARGVHGRPRDVVDDDLPADGDRAGVAAGGSVSGVEQMIASLTPRNVVVAVLLLLLAAVPVYAAVTANAFLVTLFTRVIILGIAATSLNLILGYGGMVSFGHALYLGIGGYAVGILAHEGVSSGFLQWPVALAVSALFALIVGALCLRTRGVYFIMITLAFAQLLYYFGVALERYGADDGLTIYRRSQFASVVNLANKKQFYYLCLLLLVAAIYLTWRLTNSRFGLVIQGARSNDRRMQAIGFPTYRYRLTAFVIAGTICGLAGALLANHSDFVSPAVMHWTRS